MRICVLAYCNRCGYRIPRRLQYTLAVTVYLSGYCIPQCAHVAPAHRTRNLKIILVFLCFISRPETQAYLQKVEREKQERQRGEQGDNRSFLSKYVSATFLILIFFLRARKLFLFVSVDVHRARGYRTYAIQCNESRSARRRRRRKSTLICFLLISSEVN